MRVASSRRPLSRAAVGLLALGLCAVLLAPLIAPLAATNAWFTAPPAAQSDPAPVAAPAANPVAAAPAEAELPPEPELPATFIPPLPPFATALEAAIDPALTALGRGGLARTGSFATAIAPPFQARWRAVLPDGIFAAPLVAGATVYVAGGDGTVYALDRATGGLRWSYAAGDWVLGTPALANGTLYIPSRSGSLAALDARTGAERWIVTLAGEIYTAPAVQNEILYVGTGNGGVYALNAADGAQRWALDLGAPVFTAPALSAGTLYVGTHAGLIVALDTATGAERWRVEAAGPVVTAPALAHDTLYVGSYAGSLYALDAATGAERWRFTSAAPLSSPAVDAERIVVLDANGVVHALGAADGEVYWQHALEGRVYTTDLLAPTIAGGLVYIGSEQGGDSADNTEINGSLSVLNAAAGTLISSYPTAGAVRSAAVLADDTLYIGDVHGVVYALERVTMQR
jgi:outer membrane protein assembly factor BamB